MYRECIADLETPVSTFLKVRAYSRETSHQSSSIDNPNSLYAFLLESVEGGERLARYSFVGAAPYRVITVDNPNQEPSKSGSISSSAPPSATTTTSSTTNLPPYHNNHFQGDPLIPLQQIMDTHRLLSVPSIRLPSFTGGAIGYIGYDAVRHFEPRTTPSFVHQKDMLQIPDAVFMLCDTLVIFDHVRHTIKIVSHAQIPNLPIFTDSTTVEQQKQQLFEYNNNLVNSYNLACTRIENLLMRLSGSIPSQDIIPLPAASSHAPPSPVRIFQNNLSKGIPESVIDPIQLPSSSNSVPKIGTSTTSTPTNSFDWEVHSNVGKEGYESMVISLKHRILEGDIIQAVPSQRITREIPTNNPTTAFDIYRQLRVVNPSPYMFYLELGPDFQIVGASPEMLVKVDTSGTIYTHPIAGTRRRGATPEEDDALATELLNDAKERAEHIMLVDLGRNDIGRVAAPGTVKVDSLMHIEKYSHVMHIVSNVSGKLADNKTSYDAFRSIFPAGTVSGAPKVMAVDLVAKLEPHRRGVYAGAVGYVGYSGVMDTAIAIRTLVIRGKQVHLQAGAGIVYDSIPVAEYEETLSKLRATMRAVDAAIMAGDQIMERKKWSGLGR